MHVVGVCGAQQRHGRGSDGGRFAVSVELLERARTLSAHLAQGSVAECWTDEAVDQQPVARPRGFLDLMAGQPLVQQVAERGVRAGSGPFPDLLAKPVAQRDRRSFAVGGAGQHHLLAGHRVGPTEDPDLVRAAALPDAGEIPLTPLPARHEGQCRPRSGTGSWTKVAPEPLVGS